MRSSASINPGSPACEPWKKSVAAGVNSSAAQAGAPGAPETSPANSSGLCWSCAPASLIELEPLDLFGGQTPAPVRRNRQQRYWFTTEFVLGAAQALMRLLGAHKDQGTAVADHLASTPVERTYCGPVMALLCKATHAEAVKLRSAGLREAIKIYMKTNDLERCLHLVQGLVEFHIDLLPADKQAVVSFAKERNLMNFLPAGYAH